jgi:hypothetical protein
MDDRPAGIFLLAPLKLRPAIPWAAVKGCQGQPKAKGHPQKDEDMKPSCRGELQDWKYGTVQSVQYCLQWARTCTFTRTCTHRQGPAFQGTARQARVAFGRFSAHSQG